MQPEGNNMDKIEAEKREVVGVLPTLDENNDKQILINFRMPDMSIESVYVSLDNANRLKNDINQCLKNFCYQPPTDPDASLQKFIKQIRSQNK